MLGQLRLDPVAAEEFDPPSGFNEPHANITADTARPGDDDGRIVCDSVHLDVPRFCHLGWRPCFAKAMEGIRLR